MEAFAAHGPNGPHGEGSVKMLGLPARAKGYDPSLSAATEQIDWTSAGRSSASRCRQCTCHPPLQQLSDVRTNCTLCSTAVVCAH